MQAMEMSNSVQYEENELHQANYSREPPEQVKIEEVALNLEESQQQTQSQQAKKKRGSTSQSKKAKQARME